MADIRRAHWPWMDWEPEHGARREQEALPHVGGDHQDAEQHQPPLRDQWRVHRLTRWIQLINVQTYLFCILSYFILYCILLFGTSHPFVLYWMYTRLILIIRVIIGNSLHYHVFYNYAAVLDVFLLMMHIKLPSWWWRWPDGVVSTSIHIITRHWKHFMADL